MPFDFQCEIEMKKDIFVHFNFILYLKIEKSQFFFNFQILIFIWKLKSNTFNPCMESIIQKINFLKH